VDTGGIDKDNLTTGNIVNTLNPVAGRLRLIGGMTIFSPIILFRRVDLPTLGRPIIETKPEVNLLFFILLYTNPSLFTF